MSNRLDPSDYVPETGSSSADARDEELPPYKAPPDSIYIASNCEPASPSMLDPPSPYDTFSPLPPVSAATDPNAPPTYSPHETQAQTFSVRGELIYSSPSSASAAPSQTPRYQVSQRSTRSGKPYQLRIRRLLNSEARRLSVPTRMGKQRAVDYDDEATMYIATNPTQFVGMGSAVEIKGCRASCVRGAVHMESSSGVRAGVGAGLKGLAGGGDSGAGGRRKTWRFMHITRNAAADSLKEENERRMQKYGYHADTEWNKEPMFTAKPTRSGLEWTDAAGKTVAIENGDGFQLQGDEVGEVDRTLRDLLVTCWTVKCWCDGSVRL